MSARDRADSRIASKGEDRHIVFIWIGGRGDRKGGDDDFSSSENVSYQVHTGKVYED